MTEANRPLKVFLSYASQDKHVVRELSRRLADEGWIDPWVDEKKLLPGQDWRLKIDEAVETSDIVIICLSNNSVTKEGYVQKELRYAREIALEKPEETIFLVPLRLDECEVPRGLRFYQWVDFFGEKKDESYRALAESLKLRHEQKLRLEETERVLREREKLERETAEKVEREKAERESLERISREKIEREAWEKATREQAERAATEEIERTRAKREAAEKVKREKSERRAARSIAFNIFLKSIFSKVAPFLRIIILAGIAVIVLWAGALSLLRLFPFAPTVQASPTLTPSATITLTLPSITPSPTRSPIPTMTIAINPTTTPLSIEIIDVQGVPMRLVPAGDFTMGSENDGEKPVQKVYLDAFYMDKYEVTNTLYIACVNAGECTRPQIEQTYIRNWYYGNPLFDNYPVIYIDWKQAKKYCEWRGAKLPTEAQWEKAARGTDGRIYPWGDSIDRPYANYNEYIKDTTAVGSYENGKSPYGIYDMSGNVWEWVSSLYKPYPYDPSDGREDLNASGDRVLRGGSWDTPSYFIRSAYRYGNPPDYIGKSYNAVGFRCARSLP